MHLRKLLLIALIPFAQSLSAQIVPPALGKTNTSGWLAVGVKQKLDTLKIGGWSSTTYFGIGTISGWQDNSPLKHPGIIVINQEFHHQLSKKWQYSLALSYRRQNLYSSVPPFEKSDPKYKQEFRWYGRLSYSIKLNRVTITPTFRQEASKYFTPDFKNYKESFRLRSRIRLKAAFDLNERKSQQITVFSEQLFATSARIGQKKWDRFKYNDSRFALYYSVSPTHLPLRFDLGYMHNLVGTTDTYSGHYIGFNVILNNPF